MTTVDIRAVSTCSLGELISASISDDFLDGSGLIRCKGTCEIKGTVTPALGSSVSFSWEGPHNSGSVPRTLYVIGYIADPFQNKTTVQLGCKLTMSQDFREDIKLNAWNDPLTEEEYSQLDEGIITLPISAQFVAEYCAAKLGVTGSFNLKSKFSIAAFDLSAGYYQVLSDLLASECQVGYMGNSGSALTVVNLNALPGGGIAVTADNVIDISPIGIGSVIAERVNVTYSSLKLVPPDTSNQAVLKWEKDESTGLLTTITIPNLIYPELPTNGTVQAPENFVYTYTPHSETTTEYDSLNRVTKRTTTESTILAELAPAYVQLKAPLYSNVSTTIQNGSLSSATTYYTPPQGSLPYTVVTIETFTYKTPAPPMGTEQALIAASSPPEGYEEVLEHITYTEEPKIKLIASTQIYEAALTAQAYTFDYGTLNTERFIAEKTVETADYGAEIGGTQITKTFYDRYRCAGYTQEGQQAIAAGILRGQNGASFFPASAQALLSGQFALKSLGREINISTGYKIGLQQRPSSADRNNINNTKGGSSNYRTEAKSESILIGSGNGASVTFSLPYAPDDTFYVINPGPPAVYGVSQATPSAESVARAYGTVQNRLRAGGRMGMNIVVPASDVPSGLYDGIGISAGGAAGAFAANGLTWTLNQEGAIGSVDALFIGGLGAG